jgi:hypothetical protein
MFIPLRNDSAVMFHLVKQGRSTISQGGSVCQRGGVNGRGSIGQGGGSSHHGSLNWHFVRVGVRGSDGGGMDYGGSSHSGGGGICSDGGGADVASRDSGEEEGQ